MRAIPWFLLSFLLLAAPAVAQEGGEPKVAPNAYPGVAEIVPRGSQLAGLFTQQEAEIASFTETSTIEAQISKARELQKDIIAQSAESGELSGLGQNRLQEVRGRFEEQNRSLGKVLETLSGRLSQLDKIRRAWSDKKEVWLGWEKNLQQGEVDYPKDEFRRTIALINQGVERAGNASLPLVALQKELTGLQNKNQEHLSQIEAALKNVRGKVFSKTAPSFANPDFYRQFNAELWSAARESVKSALIVRKEFWSKQGWIVTLQVLVALVLPLYLRRYRSKRELAPEWGFLLDHPWATGIFVSLFFLRGFYTNLPVLPELIFNLFSLGAGSVLVAALTTNSRQKLLVWLLAPLLFLSLGLWAIAFPQPLLRAFLALNSLVGVPLLLFLARIESRRQEPKGRRFATLLRLGTAVLLASLFAQAAGFSTLALRLLLSTLGTVFLWLFAAIAIRIGAGGIEFLVRHDILRQYDFFKRSGSELAVRLKTLFRALVMIYALFFLPVMWGLYDSVGQVWQSLQGWELPLGEGRLDASSVVLAFLVLYLSFQVSWFLQALLEAEYFPRRGLQRGVRSSIKRLLHYSLCLVGFLLAVGLLGIELKHFVVLGGAFGIGIGFGLQNIVNNFLSGLILLFERPVKLGDVIVLDSEWGTIVKIGLRSTVVETLDRSEIIVPNSQLISEKVTNWTLSSKTARVTLSVGVAYGSDVSKVLEILKEAGEQHPEVLSALPPSAIFVGFGESSLDFDLRVWIGDIGKRLQVRSEIGQFIDMRFREEGVEIPFPQRDLHLRSVDPAVGRGEVGPSGD
ncbi:mechanosensitive ion channel domain-containing protein [uncultured Desulfuromonas sp.]|uniref:mechanosensitive ion channel family protein n=1 Tax=uncultured Desulfuromonas sp. TaxID=181013 RepID=UPI002629F771|nr:mechanosensitive ion channel domain-containing protein [uncultured Desulfuromonas sp.]